MIEINELRYRNWITSKSSSVPFEVMIDDFKPIFDNPEHYFGIPLTEELLLKCNFKFKEFGYQFSVSNHLLSGNFFFMISGYAKQIYYLHELQNLYFALTGKELEIKI